MHPKGLAVVAVSLVLAQGAHSTPPAPPFEVAYRAWDLVTELARQSGDTKVSGECGRTFRPFVIPGLRMQNRQEQDVAAAACVEAARAACTNAKLQRSTEIAKRCEEFR